MANMRQSEMSDCRMIDNDERRTLVNDEHEMTNSGKDRQLALMCHTK